MEDLKGQRMWDTQSLVLQRGEDQTRTSIDAQNVANTSIKDFPWNLIPFSRLVGPMPFESCGFDEFAADELRWKYWRLGNLSETIRVCRRLTNNNNKTRSTRVKTLKYFCLEKGTKPKAP